MPNLFLVIISFIYNYLLLCFSFSKKLNNLNNVPSIINYFEVVIIIIVFYILLIVYLV